MTLKLNTQQLILKIKMYTSIIPNGIFPTIKRINQTENVQETGTPWVQGVCKSGWGGSEGGQKNGFWRH